MKILVSYPLNGLSNAKKAVENGVMNDVKTAAQSLGFSITFINHINYCSYFYTANDLDIAYRNKQPGLIKLYNEVENMIKEFDAFFVLDVNPYHPDFLEKLPVYTAFYSFDDPDASFLRSMPYAYAFDHVFTVTPIYNKETSMPDQFKKWGAKSASFIPLGVISSQYETLEEEKVFSQKRDIDLIFVGTATTVERNAKLFKVKNHFQDRFRIYGRWHWKSNVKNIITYKKPYWIKPHLNLPELYLNSKIGINIHDSDEYGFGNRRTYELPLNGAMLICDFKSTTLPDIYEVGKEAVGYENIDEAIELTEYYLKNHDERNEIALNGFRKVKENYLFSKLFASALKIAQSEIAPSK